MRKNNINLRVLFIMLLSIVMIKTNAQTGLNFQGVARTTNNVILASQAITIKLSILQGSATGTADYTEIRRVTTNAQGLFTAVIGDTGAISTLGNFTTINWKLSPKFLKIEMDAAAGNNFITMGTTQFQYVAYAQFAKSVDAENIVGIIPVTLGGTGVASIASLKTALTLNNVNNTTDLTKPISTLTQTALDLKLNAADTSKYTKQTYSDSALVAKQVLIGLKLNAADTSKYTKQTYSDSSLLTKLKISDTTSMLSSRIAKDTLNLSNRINLKANTTDVTTSLSLKESTSNKSTAVDLGGTSPSDVLFPTQKAVKDYVAANNSGGGVADGGITTIKLADAAVTDAKINTVSGSKVIGNIVGNAATATLATNATTAGNITATANTTLTSLSSLATVGTITSGVWSGTTVAVEKGGTGATTQQTAINAITGTQISGRYLRSDGTNATLSAIQIGDVPTLNQNTTGNALTATTASTVITNANLTGDVTSVGNATAIANNAVVTSKVLDANITYAKIQNVTTTDKVLGRVSSGSGVVEEIATTGTGNVVRATSPVLVTPNIGAATGSNLTTNSITNSGKVIVGASSAASASAVLEASSTTQGFLPPRLNYYQKTQITSPVAGLTIWCSNCGASGEMQVFNGAAWTNMSGGTATGTINLSIGQSYQGGIVAYILQAGDPGYDANTPHGLIAATSDQSTGIKWNNGELTTTGATGTAIGTGLSNTNTIITSQGETSTSYAAGLARAYTGGGYTDWYLPSKDELNKLYLNRTIIGGFANFGYWSSTEYDSFNAWLQGFHSGGTQAFNDKASPAYVRAIRAF